jgi:hypothetical protein
MPISNRDLTPQEFIELDEINERLRSDVLSHAPTAVESESPLVDISHYYYGFDLDALRVFDKLLAANDYDTQAIMITLMFLHGQDIVGSSEWITVDHLNAYMSVHYAIMSHEAENGGSFDSGNNRRVCRLLFPDCSNAGFIESLIRDRRIIDAYEIRRAIEGIPRTHPAVQGGAL